MTQSDEERQASHRASVKRHSQRRKNDCPDCIRDKGLKHRFGITLADVIRMVLEQGGCGICGTQDPGPHGWMVDHDHSCCKPTQRNRKTCGKCIRGILCRSCNLGIGYLKDDMDIMRKAILWVANHKKKES